MKLSSLYKILEPTMQMKKLWSAANRDYVDRNEINFDGTNFLSRPKRNDYRIWIDDKSLVIDSPFNTSI